MVTGITSISQNIHTDIAEIDNLLDATKKKDAANTIEKLKELLIEYIEANMRGADAADKKAIVDQIAGVLDKFGHDMDKANKLVETLKAVDSDPKEQTAAELNHLQDLIESLKKDVLSGEMNGF